MWLLCFIRWYNTWTRNVSSPLCHVLIMTWDAMARYSLVLFPRLFDFAAVFSFEEQVWSAGLPLMWPCGADYSSPVLHVYVGWVCYCMVLASLWGFFLGSSVFLPRQNQHSTPLQIVFFFFYWILAFGLTFKLSLEGFLRLNFHDRIVLSW